MRTKWRLLALLLIFGIASAGRCQAPPQKYSLSISLRENTVKAGGFVALDISVKNITDQEIMLGKVVGSAESAYDIVVTDSDGNPVQETSYGRKIHGKEPRNNMHDLHSEMTVQLKPGETTKEFIYLNEIYDFTRPGKYTVQVSQTVYASDADVKAGRKTIVKSNSVPLVITD